MPCFGVSLRGSEYVAVMQTPKGDSTIATYENPCLQVTITFSELALDGSANGSPGGTIRVPLNSPKVIGIAVSRGVRRYVAPMSVSI